MLTAVLQDITYAVDLIMDCFQYFHSLQNALDCSSCDN